MFFDRMQILNLIQCTNLGGMEQASLRLMRGLKARGEAVELISLNPIGQLGPLLQTAGIQHEGLPYLGKGGWRSYGLLKEKLKAVPAHGMLMTGHHLLGSLALGDYCKGRRILAIHYHHTGVKARWQWRLIYRIACRRFDAITFPCDFIRKEAEALYPPVARIAHTVRNPLDIPKLPSADEKIAARKMLGLPLDRPIVGNAGWLIPRKRFDIFLRTARKILDQNPKVLFMVAGDGSEKENLARLTSELGIGDNVRWLGWQQEMTRFYKSLDVLLFNSDWDALGLTPLEAMSFGVPAVCSVVNGGLGEILSSNEFGYLLPSHDTDALAGMVLKLLAQPDEAAKIGLAGRGHLQVVCDPEPIVEWHAKALTGRIPAVTPKATSGHSASAGKIRATVIFHRVGPYHFARARAAGKRMKTTLVEVFKSDDVYGWDPVPGTDGFQRVSLFDRNTQATSQVVRRVCAALSDSRPDVVAIPGWADAVAFAALQWCGANGVPAIVMSESTAWDESRQVLKELVKRRILKKCAAGLVGGQPHADYLVKLGMPPQHIFQGYDAVDNEYFTQRSQQVGSQGEATRTQLGLPEKFFLASARFVEKKNLLRLIEAYARYRELAVKPAAGGRPAERWDLILLGDGPLKPEIERLINDFGLQGSVRLPGFKQYHELPVYYALAKGFIHASTVEQWGLVVNEAMASGLPVLVSNRCGCAKDLVHEGINGFTFDPLDSENLADLMCRFAGSSFPIAEFGAASARIIAGWSPDRFAAGLGQAVEAALATPPPRMGKFDSALLDLLCIR